MRFFLLLLCTTALAAAQWKTALPGWSYEFPRDHQSHADFKTEWWYFTGNLQAKDGREFGYQLTFFRQGIRSSGEDIIPLSRFVTKDMKFAHFALSDISKIKFRFFQKFSRGAYGESGFSESRLAWIDDWSCELVGDNRFHISAKSGDVSLDLDLNSAKPAVFHGSNGVSQKSEGAGRASHYYSFTRMVSSGTLRLGTEDIPVTGQSWFDHEWATNQLAANQVGWDWLSVQFSDNTELMIFQLRSRDGSRDVHSAGTFVDAAGKSTPVSHADFVLEPMEYWTSPHTGARYPTGWQLKIARLGLDVTVQAALKDQELRLKPVTYWEGAVKVQGKRQSAAITGVGYLEMTGYAGTVEGMRASE